GEFFRCLSFIGSYSIPTSTQRSKRHRRHTNLSSEKVEHFLSPCRHTNVFLEIIERLKKAAQNRQASRPKMDEVTFVEQTRHLEIDGIPRLSTMLSESKEGMRGGDQ
ncbi:hypothetical protein PFISCL1PPCAC_3480, partial [Pristionchus fissidentatus]